MAPVDYITGVILAGGASSRFGSNKALALWRGKPLIQHVRDTMASVFSECLLVTNAPEQYTFLNLPMIQDRFQNMGPLAGLHAALSHTDKTWIFVMGCDMPAVPPGVIVFLCNFAKDDWDAVIPWPKTGPEPLCGLYRKSALAKVEMQLQHNEAQLMELLQKIAVRKVEAVELHRVTDSSEIFVNINREQDLDRLP